MSGLKIKRKNAPNTEVNYDTAESEFRFNRDSTLRRTAHKEIVVGNINSSTGQVESNFDVANDGTTTLEGFEWTYDSNNEELVFSDPDGIELMRHPKAGSTQFLQGIDVAYPFETPEDSLTNFVNAPNTSATSSGDTVGYNFSVNNQTVAQVSADSDGSGGIGGGKFIVRKAGGIVGADELQIFHDGGGAHIVSKQGGLELESANFVTFNSPINPRLNDIGSDSGGKQVADLYINGDLRDSNDNELFGLTSNSTAVNYLNVANAATGNAPTISAVGDDTNVDLAVKGKGTGRVVVENSVFRISSENTGNPEGAIQFRDASTGDLFTFSGAEGNVAKHEGSSALTFGIRDSSSTIGQNSVVIGGTEFQQNIASGNSAVAIGGTAFAEGETAVALNSGNASGIDATAMGGNTFANGDRSVAMGDNSEANDNYSFSMGFETIAGGRGALAVGDQSEATNSLAVAMGSSPLASGNTSFAVNSNTEASAPNSSAFGNSTVSRVPGGIAVGLRNQDDVGSGNEVGDTSSLSLGSKLFVTGTGDSNSDPTNNTFFDGRGRKDEFFVTFRKGVYSRDAIRGIDNENNSFFETELQIRSIYYRPDLSTTGTTGTGTTNEYAVLVRNGDGNRTLLSPVNTINVDNTALDSSNFVTIDWSGSGRERSLDGGVYVVLKDEGQTGSFQILGTTTSTSLDDTGQSLSSFTAPTENETSSFSFGAGSFKVDSSGTITQGGAVGSDAEVQFNDNGNFGSSSEFLFKKGRKVQRLELGNESADTARQGNIATNQQVLSNELSSSDFTWYSQENSLTLFDSDTNTDFVAGSFTTFVGQRNFTSIRTDLFGTQNFDFTGETFELIGYSQSLGITGPQIDGIDKAVSYNSEVGFQEGGFTATLAAGYYDLFNIGNLSSDSYTLQEYASFYSEGATDGPGTINDLYGLYVKDENPADVNRNSAAVENNWGFYVESGMTNVSVGQTLIGESITDDASVTATVDIRGSVSKGTRNNVATNTSTQDTDYYIGVDTSAGSFTVTLSSTDATDGREIVIHDQGDNASGNSITIDTEGSETVSGAQYGTALSSIELNTDAESATLRSDGTNWYVV